MSVATPADSTSSVTTTALDSFTPYHADRGVLEHALAMRHAGPRSVRIAWEWQGPDDAPVIVAQGGISATRHVGAGTRFAEPGWWQVQCGAGKALDTNLYRVLAIDWLGADGCLDVCIDPLDQANALIAVLDHLNIPQIHSYIGASYGAMVGLQLAAHYPQRLRHLIAISGAHRAHPYSTALRVIQRRIVALGRSEGGIREALALARSLAVIGYRSNTEFEQRFAKPAAMSPDKAQFPVEAFFDTLGPQFVARFSPVAYQRLSESIDLQSLEPEDLRVPTDIVAVAEDQIIPEADLSTLSQSIAAPCRFHRLHSVYGHDAFLEEVAAISTLLHSLLNTPPSP